MPSVIMYLRQVDYPIYLDIQSKGRGAWTEFIHKALNEKKNKK